MQQSSMKKQQGQANEEIGSVQQIPHQTLVSLLKQKAVHISSLQRKLKKEQDAIGKLHHQRTSLNLKTTLFNEFLSVVFPQQKKNELLQIDQITLQRLTEEYNFQKQTRDEENKILKAKLLQSENSFDQLNEKYQGLLESKKKLSSEDEEKKAKIQELQGQLKLFDNQIKERQRQIQTFKDQNSKLNQKIQKSQLKCQNLQLDYQELVQKNEQLQKSGSQGKQQVGIRIQKLYSQLLVILMFCALTHFQQSKQKAGKLLACKQKQIMELRIALATVQKQNQYSTPPTKRKNFSLEVDDVLFQQENKDNNQNSSQKNNNNFNNSQSNNIMIDKMYMQSIIFNYLKILTEGNQQSSDRVQQIMFSSIDMPNNMKNQLKMIRNKSAFWSYIWSFGEKAVTSVKSLVKRKSTEEELSSQSPSNHVGFGCQG